MPSVDKNDAPCDFHGVEKTTQFVQLTFFLLNVNIELLRHTHTWKSHVEKEDCKLDKLRGLFDTMEITRSIIFVNTWRQAKSLKEKD